jgi:6-pyruvoyltetrahydropterin/6-carboxytetrahydropterin synthase
MYRITKEFSFSMGHRLSCHQGLCKNFHGHNYTVFVGLKSETLNPNGMVMDFGDLKGIVENYLKRFDHAMMINKADSEKFLKLQAEMPFLKVMVVDYEPTAENMAREFYHYFKVEVGKYFGNAVIDYVSIFETDKSQATYSED